MPSIYCSDNMAAVYLQGQTNLRFPLMYPRRQYRNLPCYFSMVVITRSSVPIMLVTLGSSSTTISLGGDTPDMYYKKVSVVYTLPPLLCSKSMTHHLGKIIISMYILSMVSCVILQQAFKHRTMFGAA